LTITTTSVSSTVGLVIPFRGVYRKKPQYEMVCPKEGLR